MDKTIIYPGQVPLDKHLLAPQRAVEYALGYLMQAVIGTTPIVDGLTVTQQASPNMTVLVAAGCIISQTTVDPTGVAFGSLALDTGNLVKIGINTAGVSMSALTAPATAGQSQNWIVQAKFLESDGTATVLPYYNTASPSTPYSGPAGAGTSQNTIRSGTVQLGWKSGTAAATGQQSTPTPDSGFVGLAIVTLTNGDASITNAKITAYSSAPYMPAKMAIQRTRLTAPLTIYVSPTGSDSASGLSVNSPFLTIQKAWNFLLSNYDLNGQNVTIQLANGTYSSGLIAAGAALGLTGGNSITILGNTGSPSSVVISCSASHCIVAQNNASISVSGLKLTTTAGSLALLLASQGQIAVAGPMEFGAATGIQLWATNTGYIQVNSNYTVSGGGIAHLYASSNSFINGNAIAITFTGAPSFASSGFAAASVLGSVVWTGGTFLGTFASVTGPRYNVINNGVVATNGAGSTYFPGNSVIATATGGQYV